MFESSCPLFFYCYTFIYTYTFIYVYTCDVRVLNVYARAQAHVCACATFFFSCSVDTIYTFHKQQDCIFLFVACLSFN